MQDGDVCQKKKKRICGKSILKKTPQLERKMRDPRGEGFLLFIGSQAFHSFASPFLSVCLCLFLSGGKIWRAPCPVIKLLPVRWEREIHHAEALVHPANPHH